MAPNTLDRIRTCDLSFRKAALYPTELLGRLARGECHGLNIVKKRRLFTSKQGIFPWAARSQVTRFPEDR